MLGLYEKYISYFLLFWPKNDIGFCYSHIIIIICPVNDIVVWLASPLLGVVQPGLALSIIVTPHKKTWCLNF